MFIFQVTAVQGSEMKKAVQELTPQSKSKEEALLILKRAYAKDASFFINDADALLALKRQHAKYASDVISKPDGFWKNAVTVVSAKSGGTAALDKETMMQKMQELNQAMVGIETASAQFDKYSRWDDLASYVGIGASIDSKLQIIKDNLDYLLPSLDDGEKEKIFDNLRTTLAGLEGAGFKDIVVRTKGVIDVDLSLARDGRAAENFTFKVAGFINQFNLIDNKLRGYYLDTETDGALNAAIEMFAGLGARKYSADDVYARDFAVRAIFGDSDLLQKIFSTLVQDPSKALDREQSIALQYVVLCTTVRDKKNDINDLNNQASSINPEAAKYLLEAPQRQVVLPTSPDIINGQSNRESFSMFSYIAGLNLIVSNPEFSTPLNGVVFEKMSIDDFTQNLLKLKANQQDLSDLIASASLATPTVSEDDFKTSFNLYIGNLTAVSNAFAGEPSLQSTKGKIDAYLATLGAGVCGGADGVWQIARGNDPNNHSGDLAQAQPQFDLAVEEAGSLTSGINKPKDIFMELSSEKTQNGMAFWLLNNPKLYATIYRNTDNFDIDSKTQVMRQVMADSQGIFMASPTQNRISNVDDFANGVSSANIWTDNLVSNFTNRAFKVVNGNIQLNKEAITGESQRAVWPQADMFGMFTSMLPNIYYGQPTPITVPSSPNQAFADSYIPSLAQSQRAAAESFKKRDWASVYLRDIFISGISREYSLDISSALYEVNAVYRSMLTKTGLPPALFSPGSSLYGDINTGHAESNTNSTGVSGQLGTTNNGSSAQVSGLYRKDKSEQTQKTTFNFLDSAENFRLMKDGFLDRVIIDRSYGSVYQSNEQTIDKIFGHSKKTVNQDISQSLNASGQGSSMVARFNRHYFSTESLSNTSEAYLFTLDNTGALSDPAMASLASQLGVNLSLLQQNAGVDDNTILGKSEMNGKIYFIRKTTVGNQAALEVYQATGQMNEREWYYDKAQVYYRITGRTWVELDFNDEYRNSITKYLGQQYDKETKSEFVKNYYEGVGITDYKAVQLIEGVQVAEFNQASGRHATDTGFFIGIGSEELFHRANIAVVGGSTIRKEKMAGVVVQGDNYKNKGESYHKHTFWASYYEIDRNSLAVLPNSSGMYVQSQNEQVSLDNSYLPISDFAKLGMVEYQHQSMANAVFNASIAGADYGFAGGRAGYQSKGYSRGQKGTGSVIKGYGYFNWTEKLDANGQKIGGSMINSAVVGSEGEFQSIPLKFVLQYNKYPDSTSASYKGAVLVTGKSGENVKWGVNLSVNWHHPPTEKERKIVQQLSTDVSVLSTAYGAYQKLLENPYSSEYLRDAARTDICNAMNSLFSAADRQSIFQKYGNQLSDISLTFTRTRADPKTGEKKDFGGTVMLTDSSIEGVDGPLVATFLDLNKKWSIVAMTSAESPGKVQTLGIGKKGNDFKAIIVATRISGEELTKEITSNGMNVTVSTRKPDTYLVEAALGKGKNTLELSGSTDDFYKIQFTHAGKNVTLITNVARVGAINDFSQGFTSVGAKGVGYWGQGNRLALGIGLQFYEDLVKKNAEISYTKVGKIGNKIGYYGLFLNTQWIRGKTDFYIGGKFGVKL